jgi:hypothetical protein
MNVSLAHCLSTCGPFVSNYSIFCHVRCVHHAQTATDYTVTVECSEPELDHAKQQLEEQWYAAVNSECKCGKLVLCGDACKQLLHSIRGIGAMSTTAKRRALARELDKLRARWRKHSNSHNSAAAAVCNYALMPQELLPHVVKSYYHM